MYSVASARLGLAAELTPLQWISELMIWIAFGAWVIALFGLIKKLGRLFTNTPDATVNKAP